MLITNEVIYVIFQNYVVVFTLLIHAILFQIMIVYLHTTLLPEANLLTQFISFLNIIVIKYNHFRRKYTNDNQLQNLLLWNILLGNS